MGAVLTITINLGSAAMTDMESGEPDGHAIADVLDLLGDELRESVTVGMHRPVRDANGNMIGKLVIT